MPALRASAAAANRSCPIACSARALSGGSQLPQPQQRPYRLPTLSAHRSGQRAFAAWRHASGQAAPWGRFRDHLRGQTALFLILERIPIFYALVPAKNMRVTLYELAADTVAHLGKGKVTRPPVRSAREKTTCIITSPSSSQRSRGHSGRWHPLPRRLPQGSSSGSRCGSAPYPRGSRSPDPAGSAMIATRSSAVYCCFFQGMRS